jgi:hypothetical protein
MDRQQPHRIEQLPLLSNTSALIANKTNQGGGSKSSLCYILNVDLVHHFHTEIRIYPHESG